MQSESTLQTLLILNPGSTQSHWSDCHAGLDSFAALSVMEHMSQLACAGHTIIASIHQPRADIFARFNKIVILSEGYQVYAGCPSRSVDWFSTNLNYKYNTSDGAVSDWIMDTVSVSFAKPKDIAKRSVIPVLPAPTREGSGFQLLSTST